VRVSRTPGQLPQHGAGELAVGGHVRHAGLQQVVEAARDHVAFHDLLAHLHRGLELVEHVGRGAVQQHLDEDGEAAPQLVRIEPRLVAQDEPVAREPLHARQHRGGRQRHRLGQLEVGDPAVLLKDLQEPEIDAVEIEHRMIIRRACRIEAEDAA
jgi:hypothetical protein